MKSSLLEGVLRHFDGKHYLLHYAVAAEQNAILSISLLVDAGAPLTLRNFKGQTAQQAALECGRHEEAEMLSSHSKKK